MFRKYACVKQQEMKDCGAACIATICKYYGRHFSVSRIRELAGTDLEGTTAFGLLHAARKLGFEAKAVKGQMNQLYSTIPLPAIAHVVTESMYMHYVVIHRVRRHEVIVADPAQGVIKLTPAQFSELWTGVLFFLVPTDRLLASEIKPHLIRKCLQIMAPHRKLLFGVWLASLLFTILGILGAFYFRIILDEILPRQSMNMLHLVSIGMFVVVVCRVGIYLWRSRLILIISQQFDQSLTFRLFQHIVNLPMRFFLTRQSGEVLSRIQDVTFVRDALSVVSLTILMDTLMIAGGGTILYLQSPMLFGLTLLFIPIYVYIGYYFRKPYEKQKHTLLKNHEKFVSHFLESIQGMETLKACGAENQSIQIANTKLKQELRSEFHLGCTMQWQSAWQSLIHFGGGIVIVWAGAYSVIQGTWSIGQLITCNVLAMYVLEPIQNMLRLQPQFQSAVVAMQRLHEITDLPIENQQAHDPSDSFVSFQGEIRFHDISFRYGARPLTLKGVHLTIGAGEKVAIVGTSGSGKSTIAKLLMNFYQAEQGEILVHGCNLQQIPLALLRRKVAYVAQEQAFFRGTIIENIRLGEEESISREVVEQSIRDFHLEAFIQSLSRGLDTPVEENGASLSGGQKQLLAILRAVVRKPEVLILDEATCHLDFHTEQMICEKILMWSGLTTLVIAHRLSAIEHCDIIYVMEEGRIVESGNHLTLMDADGKYRKLWTNQSSRFSGVYQSE